MLGHLPPTQYFLETDFGTVPLLRPQLKLAGAGSSNYPPAKPEALRWLAPQRGLTATVGKRPLTRPRPSATLSPREREKAIARRSAPNTAFALSQGRGWTAPRAFPSGRGTGEGSLPDPAPLLRSMSNSCCLPAPPGSHNGLGGVSIWALIESPETTRSTRRFFSRPCAASLDAMGLVFPNPFAVIELAGIPAPPGSRERKLARSSRSTSLTPGCDAVGQVLLPGRNGPSR